MSISVLSKKISINMQDQFQIQAERLANKFSSISDFAEQLAFPDYHKGIFAQKDLRKLRATEKYLYNFTHPFTTPDKLGLKFFSAWFASIAFTYFAFAIGLVFLYPVLFNAQPLLFPPKDTASQIFTVVGLFCAIPVTIISFYWWIETLRDRKNPRLIKLLLIGVVLWSLSKLNSVILQESPSASIWESADETMTVLLSFGLFLIPTISYFFAIIFDTLLFVLFTSQMLFGGINSIHEPRPIKTILKLATAKIPSRNLNDTPWSLSDLTKTEITQLRRWAEVNRESSEKRTIPAFLILAVIGILLASELIRDAFDRFVYSLIKSTDEFLNARSLFTVSVSNILLVLVTIIIVVFLISLAKNVLTLFRNIMAQNLIVEACILAENSIEEVLPVQQKTSLVSYITSLFTKGKR